MSETGAMTGRGYTKCAFGQLHFMVGEPAVRSGLTPLVLLHQNPSSSMEYAQLLREMARDRVVIAFDTPGNGMSDRPPEPQSIAAYAGAFADGLAALGYGEAGSGKVDVFGFHSGSFYAAELSAARPDLVRRAVLSGIPYRTHAERRQRLDDAVNAAPLAEDGAAVFAKFEWLWNFIVAQRDPKVPLERAAEMFMEKCKPMHRSSWPYVGVWGYPAEERLPAITQPTLVIAPQDMTFDTTIAAAALIPNAQLILFDDVTRDFFEIAVDRYAEAMRHFLDRPTASTRT